MTTYDETTLVHEHEWRLVVEEIDLHGTVREYACLGCDDVQFA